MKASAWEIWKCDVLKSECLQEHFSNNIIHGYEYKIGSGSLTKCHKQRPTTYLTNNLEPCYGRVAYRWLDTYPPPLKVRDKLPFEILCCNLQVSHSDYPLFPDRASTTCFTPQSHLTVLTNPYSCIRQSNCYSRSRLGNLKTIVIHLPGSPGELDIREEKGELASTALVRPRTPVDDLQRSLSYIGAIMYPASASYSREMSLPLSLSPS